MRRKNKVNIGFCTQLAFAKKYGCNIQKTPMGKAITQKENNKYIKQFDFETPIKKMKSFMFKNITVTLHKSEKGNIPLSFKNTTKDYEVSTEFKDSQDILRINTNSDETFICWSVKASKEATEKKI